jgi:MoxR-like ATPase
MNIQDFKKYLPTLLKNNIVPFTWGNQGIGKTQSIAQVAAQAGIGFVHLHLATQEVGDLVGLLMIQADGTVKHARPEWFPTEGEGIIFLDELNRAHPDVIQAMFSFITSKTIHTHKLPDGWKIVAAGNYQSDQFNVTDTSDAAWMSRFCHIELQPTVQEFTEALCIS